MMVLNREDYRMIKNLVGLTQEGMRKTMAAYLKKKYKNVIVTKDYIMAEGDIPVGLVAHMDTVFKTPAEDVYYDRESGVMWSPQGLGADDRAGIFGIIKILQSGYRPSVILTCDEEIGCVGASQLALDFPEKPWKLNYLVQLDRRNSIDCVFYDCENPDFTKFIEGFGFVEAMGSFSDISVICPEWGIAGVNLSIGYVGEHSETERLFVGRMLATISKVKEILEVKEQPEFEYISAYGSNYWNYGCGGAWNFDANTYRNLCRKHYGGSFLSEEELEQAYGYGSAFSSDYREIGPTEEEFECYSCGKRLDDFEAIPAKDYDGAIVSFCPDCCPSSIDWCTKCNAGFVDYNKISNEGSQKDEGPALCYDCQCNLGLKRTSTVKKNKKKRRGNKFDRGSKNSKRL